MLAKAYGGDGVLVSTSDQREGVIRPVNSCRRGHGWLPLALYGKHPKIIENLEGLEAMMAFMDLRLEQRCRASLHAGALDAAFGSTGIFIVHVPWTRSLVLK